MQSIVTRFFSIHSGKANQALQNICQSVDNRAQTGTHLFDKKIIERIPEYYKTIKKDKLVELFYLIFNESIIEYYQS